MPALKPTYEAFCQAYVANPNATAAAQAAGYLLDHAHQQGYRLMRRPAITGRIAELRQAQAERECLTPEALLSKLDAAFHAALKNDQPAAAARIVEAQAKIATMFMKMDGMGAKGVAALDATRAALAAMAKQLGLPAPQFDIG
jgi:phage terminase small subunit